MDAKLKRKWIRALRSGKYRQAEGSLFDGEGYCCLGVLATIQGCNIEKIIPDPDNRVTEDLPRGFNAGLRPHHREALAARNDGVYSVREWKLQEKHDFKQIADYIEKNL